MPQATAREKGSKLQQVVLVGVPSVGSLGQGKGAYT